MTSVANALAKAQLVNLVPTAARTATGQGSFIDLLDYEGMAAVVLDAAAGTGTTPTLAVSLEESDDGSTGIVAVPAGEIMEGSNFTALATTASQQVRHINVSERKRFVREAHAISGTTPSYTYAVNLLAQKKYA